ncbi:transposase [Bifidobacterium pseudolongum]|uniref:transposase n=1 Tax=Bifidobacterium pseudolongum TaxID=1694 RepID=UPI001F0F52A6|nr:transposase [Bifidobacterium pseudolongum]MCH4861002.1 transposase [Bifidobacterium pseudolongum]MCH4862794.1 transposase [Bifidobacterium pseudolongum]
MTKRKIAQRIPFTPSKTQAVLLEQCFGARRFAYNQQVEVFNTYDKDTNPRPAYPNVTVMKNTHAWLKDSPVPSNALSNAIMDFRKSVTAYFRKAQYGKNRPRFASRHDAVQSFRNTMPIRRMDGNRYPLSKKLGSIRIGKRHKPRFPLDQLSSWTVKREGDKYHIVFLFDVDVQPKPAVPGRVGIDLGVKDFLVLSTGEKINYPQRLHQLEQTIIREQRRLSRKRKGTGAQSNNYYKQKTRLRKAYRKLHDWRDDYQHQVSHRLIEENQFIGMETLMVANMSRKAKKRVDETGRLVRNGQARKRTMNRNIRRVAWSGFADKLAYKAQWYGRTFQQVDRFYPSSRLCHECGWKNTGLTLRDRQWDCPACGARHDRDVNAARNILGEALRLNGYN